MKLQSLLNIPKTGIHGREKFYKPGQLITVDGHV